MAAVESTCPHLTLSYQEGQSKQSVLESTCDKIFRKGVFEKVSGVYLRGIWSQQYQVFLNRLFPCNLYQCCWTFEKKKTERSVQVSKNKLFTHQKKKLDTYQNILWDEHMHNTIRNVSLEKNLYYIKIWPVCLYFTSTPPRICNVVRWN